MKRKLIAMLLVFAALLTMLPVTAFAADEQINEDDLTEWEAAEEDGAAAETTAGTNYYDVEKAMEYAAAHWNDGEGLCAAFVSKCVSAGGYSVNQSGTGGCARAIMKLAGITYSGKYASALPELKLDANGYATQALDGDILHEGDVVVQYCNTHEIAPHILICAGYNSSGKAVYYAHNGALNKKTYKLSVNTAYEHTTSCDMGGRVIQISKNALAVPTVKVSNVYGGVSVTWNQITGATGYIVYRKNPDGSWKTCTTLSSGSTLSYTDTTAVCGTSYYYTVRATANSGAVRSKYTLSSSIMYLATPAVTLSHAEDGVTVTWNQITGATGYSVYRMTVGTDGSWPRIADLSGGSTLSYTDRSVESGVTYCYAVRATTTNSGSNSATKSGGSIIWLAVPTVTVSNTDSGITVNWNQITGATGYIVYQKASDGTVTRIADLTDGNTLSYTDATAEPGQSYSYTVRATANNGNEWSEFQYSSEICHTVSDGWHSVGSDWYYYQNNSRLTGWQKSDSKWYYLDPETGVMLTGWQKVDGSWYYLKNYMLTGWQKIDGKWYYLNNAMKTGWQKVDGKWYYLKNYMLTGWQKIDGKWYYLNTEMKTGWQKVDGSWYYLNNAMVTGWQKINNVWYYFGTNGAMVSDCTMTIDGKDYTFAANGAWVG